MADRPTAAQATQHVVYEIEAMCAAAARYAETWDASVNAATPPGLEDSVFFLEAALVHARTLITTFGYPAEKEEHVLAALGLSAGCCEPFREGFSHPDVDSSRAYGQVSELVAHIGKWRWEAPVEIAVHQPVEVAYAVLDALERSGVTEANEEVLKAVNGGRERVTDAV